MEITKFKYNNEKVFLCSDGLYNSLESMDIEAVLATEDTSEQKGQMLISLANNRGGEDNIAVALWEPDND
jgi:protein phosphatase